MTTYEPDSCRSNSQCQQLSALIWHVEQEPDVIMNLDPHKYTVKLQKKGKWKWYDNVNTTREMSGFLVGEDSDQSGVRLMDDRLVSFFSGVRQLIIVNCIF